MNSTLFLGALIGAGTSIVITAVQQWFQTKRHRLEIASKLAIVDYEIALKGSGKVLPISVWLI
jgi:hypothetical protein